MEASFPPLPGPLDPLQRIQPAFRAPRRITITVPYLAHQRLLRRSEREGRSLSNLMAFLLESALAAEPGFPPPPP
ncbi:MAG: ribbon-helix-helix domain-containing protein [Cyanobium sp.]